ncbi:MAG: efflux transporter outer membrane subunit [Proteobacteria bacterium]|nr:efflux transporter outer membrane subunit [Pseudomonadota bacterium]
MPRYARTIALTALVAGCAAVGPNYTAPPAPRSARYTHEELPAATASAPVHLGSAQRFAASANAAPDWWRTFGSAHLDALVDEALANNPTLEAARATLRQARETYAAQAGSTLYPTVTGKLGVSRNQSNAAGSGQPGDNQTVYSLYNANVGVAYNVDLFGGNRRTLEGLAAQADYQQYQLEAARLAIAGNVATAAFTQAQFSAQRDATQSILTAQRDQLAIARQRFELGATSRADVLALETQTEQTRARLPALESQIEQANHLLAILTGREPGDATIPHFTLDEFELPATLPVVVPSDLVRQRPDIQASAALLHAATAQYGVAVANLYPQVNLSASLGAQALTAGALFGPGSAIWSLAGGLAQPLFNAGLKSAASAAEAGLQAAGANYRETVLQALRNVADALRALDADARVLDAQVAADTAANGALALTSDQYQLGGASYLQLLVAQLQAQQTRIGVIEAQAQRLADSASLFQAVGGGVTMSAAQEKTARTE